MRFNPHLQHIAPYEAGKPIELVMREYGIARESIIKLASNENPYGTSPKVLEVLKNNVHTVSLYPDDSYYELKEALARKFSVDSQNLIIGSGSDQVIEFCLHARTGTSKEFKILQAGVTFAMYEIYAKLFGAQILKTKSLAHDLDEILELQRQENADIIFICAPNNPLGECVDTRALYAFLEQISESCLVVIDGAYQEYARFKDAQKGIEPLELIKKFSNVIYLGTFSKAYGLGGMRVGYGIGNVEMIKALHKVRPPFNITTLSLLAAITTLQDEEFIAHSLSENFKQMRVYEDFAKAHNIAFIPSWTNFITFVGDFYENLDVTNETNIKFDSTKFCDFCLQKGVILRNLKSYNLNAFRVSIGTQAQNKRVLELFGEFLGLNK